MALEMITRSGNSGDPLVPEPVSAEIIKELPKSSAALTLCRRATMSTKTSRQPVLSLLPEAYWVSGDDGLKDTTKADWENLEMVAEELAVIIPVPEAYLSDSQVPIWAELRPLVTEAFGRALDKAVLFGTSKPITWTSPAIIPGAVSAGNTVAFDPDADLGVLIAGMGEDLEDQGYAMNSFAVKPGFRWRLAAARSAQGVAIYGSGDLASGFPSTIYGAPTSEVQNGAWNADAALLVGGDFSKAIVGIRQDLSFKVFTEGVITDANGKVLLNLMQQDSVAMRFVMRMGYALANPISPLAAIEDRFPFTVMTPEGS
jgi:HK97 family phage major capsid protein